MTFPDRSGSISQTAERVHTRHLRKGQSYKQTKDHRNLRIPDIRQTKGRTSQNHRHLTIMCIPCLQISLSYTCIYESW